MSGRIRTVKPEWLEDSKMARLSDAERLLSIALLLVADDHGRGRAEPEFIASRAWVYHPQDGLLKAQEGLLRLSEVGYVTLYAVDGQRYFEIRNWTKHQKVNHPSAPRIPGSDQGVTLTCEQSQRPSRDPLETSREPQESLLPDLRSPITDHRSPIVESAPEVAPTSHEPAPKRAKPKPPSSAPPAPADVPTWLTGLGVPALDDARWGREVTRWLDHHRAKGSRFVDWAAAWRTWRSRAEEYSRGPLGTPGTQNATTGRFRRTTTVQNAGAAMLPSPWDIGLEPDTGTEAP
jgi:hypothetical protein